MAHAAAESSNERRDIALAPNAQWIDLWRGDPGYRDDVGALPVQAPVTVLLDRAGRVRLRLVGRIAPDLWDDVAALVLN